MTICPIALAVGCEKCPAFKFCPLTTVLGDQEEKDESDEEVDLKNNDRWKLFIIYQANPCTQAS